MVHSDVTKRGLDRLLGGKDELLTGQKEQLAVTRDGILALAQKTRASFDAQRDFIRDKFAEADARQQKRNETIVDMWSEPLEILNIKLEEERIAKEKEEIHAIRAWISRAEPESNYEGAKDKRPVTVTLGGWLLKHPIFDNWERSRKSSILWCHGFAGTGKTGLSCRVVGRLRDKLKEAPNAKLAFFFCSNDRGDDGRVESASRSNPEEALRSIVSQVSTSQQDRHVADIVRQRSESHGPDSDTHRTLGHNECVNILATMAKETAIHIVIDAFDELDQSKSPKLLQDLKSLVERAPLNVKIFLATRPFPAIDDEFIPEQSIEVSAENNGDDVREFIQRTLQVRTLRSVYVFPTAVFEQYVRWINTTPSGGDNGFLGGVA